MPTLGIVIAAYNERKYLPEQLSAIFSQRDVPDELVLVDDGSTDDTFEIMRRVPGRISARCHVKIVSMPKNVGCAAATNRGVAESTSDYVYIASANDVMMPFAVAAIREAIGPSLEGYPHPDLIVGDVDGIHLGWRGRDSTYISPNDVAALFGHRGIIHAAGAIISRRAWDHHGGWDAAFWPYSETLTWHVTACRYGVVYTPHAIAAVRRHEGSASTTVLDREYRRPLMAKAAQFVNALDEPVRSRLISSGLWSIAEWAPDMLPLLVKEAHTLVTAP